MNFAENYLTNHDEDLNRRRERIRKKYIALKKQYPDLKYTRICAMIVEDEKKTEPLDGIKSLSGIIYIVKNKLHLNH